jgi:charged multivesicular body protein 5
MSGFNRLFGKPKEKAPPPSLGDAIARTEGLGDSVDKKIQKLDEQLRDLNKKMKSMPNGPAKNRVKQRAMMILRQKKQYENQGINLQKQIFNMDQQNMAIESVKTTKETVNAMKHGVKALRAEFKTMSLD